MKSAPADDNILASTGKISNFFEEDGRTKSSQQRKTKNVEELIQMMCNLLRCQSAPSMEMRN